MPLEKKKKNLFPGEVVYIDTSESVFFPKYLHSVCLLHQHPWNEGGGYSDMFLLDNFSA